MRVLLDENLPQALRIRLPGHDVATTAFQGWAGWSNGALIKAADDGGFDVLVTADQGINYQQSLKGRSIALVVLSTNKNSIVLANAAKILAAINESKARRFTFVEIE